MKLIQSVLLAGVTILVGCAHSSMRGSVAMKTSANEAHVCLGNKEVKVGDHVNAYKNFCPLKGARPNNITGPCEKRALGKGIVSQLLNEHYSVVTFDDGVKFDEGTFVETY
jgi:hypothetical protein